MSFEVTLTNGDVVEVHNPSDMPDPARIQEIREPYIKASILLPKEYVGVVMELCQERRGEHRACTTSRPTACSCTTTCR